MRSCFLVLCGITCQMLNGMQLNFSEQRNIPRNLGEILPYAPKLEDLSRVAEEILQEQNSSTLIMPKAKRGRKQSPKEQSQADDMIVECLQEGSVLLTGDTLTITSNAEETSSVTGKRKKKSRRAILVEERKATSVIPEAAAERKMKDDKPVSSEGEDNKISSTRKRSAGATLKASPDASKTNTPRTGRSKRKQTDSTVVRGGREVKKTGEGPLYLEGVKIDVEKLKKSAPPIGDLLPQQSSREASSGGGLLANRDSQNRSLVVQHAQRQTGIVRNYRRRNETLRAQYPDIDQATARTYLSLMPLGAKANPRPITFLKTITESIVLSSQIQQQLRMNYAPQLKINRASQRINRAPQLGVSRITQYPSLPRWPDVQSF